MRTLLSALGSLGLAFAWALLAPCSLSAQTWPEKPVKVIAAYPPGGTVDALARAVAPHLQQRLGQSVYVENRTGAGGTIAGDYVAKSLKDGYTVLVGAVGNISSAGSLYKALPYDPVRDLAPVMLATRVSNLLVVHPSLGVKSVAELIAKAKAQPGKLAYGSGGVGTSLHLAGELFKLMAKVDIVHVPYKGSGPAVADLVSGQLLLAVTDTAILEHAKAGSVVILAQTAGVRLPQIKDIPTLAESGVAGYDAVNWQGFFVAAGTPAPIVARLNAELVAILKLDDVRARLEGLGLAPTTSSPEEFAQFIAGDVKLWSDVIAKAGITADQ